MLVRTCVMLILVTGCMGEAPPDVTDEVTDPDPVDGTVRLVGVSNQPRVEPDPLPFTPHGDGIAWDLAMQLASDGVE